VTGTSLLATSNYLLRLTEDKGWRQNPHETSPSHFETSLFHRHTLQTLCEMMKLWRTNCMSNLSHYVYNIKQDNEKGENREKLWAKTKVQERIGVGNWYYERNFFTWREYCSKSNAVLRLTELLRGDSSQCYNDQWRLVN